MISDTRGDNEELALIQRARGGDHEAFRLLVLSYETQLLAYLTHMLGDSDSARDVAQDTFVAVYYSLPRWKPLLHTDGRDTTYVSSTTGHPLAPWLYRIATNKAISLLRKNSFYARTSKTGHSSVTSVTPTATPQNVKQQASDLIRQFHQEVTTWGTTHMYQDSFDGHAYQLDDAYSQAGLGSILDDHLAQAQTDADFQSVVDETNNALFNLHMLEADAADSTPFNQSHHSDRQLLNHYQLKGQVMVVSLAGQAMRVYQNGQLVKAFLVTTGQPKLPALPIVTKELFRLSPTTFKSGVPKGDPGWYPDTRITYAIEYHTGGYYLHDASWLINFGPGTQFPHQDSSGTQSHAGDGGINLTLNDAAWVYNHTNLNTTIVIY